MRTKIPRTPPTCLAEFEIYFNEHNFKTFAAPT